MVAGELVLYMSKNKKKETRFLLHIRTYSKWKLGLKCEMQNSETFRRQYQKMT